MFFQSLDKKELAELVRTVDIRARERLAGARSRQLFKWFYRKGVTDFEAMSDVSKELRAWLHQNAPPYSIREKNRQTSGDGTIKFLWELDDGNTVESVIIPAGEPGDEEDADSGGAGRVTACISSQAGCAMNCAFCNTGHAGFERNLEVHEIIGQVLAMQRAAENAVPITNIVFMGMGEPLLNLENIIKACDILLDGDGLNFSRRKVTVSTCGIVPAMAELGSRCPVSLAVSLNAVTDALRDKLMPVNKKWNIKSLLAACRKYPLGPKRRITLEYVLLAGINDSDDDARMLARLVRGMPVKINLIRFNAFAGAVLDAVPLQGPSAGRARKFQEILMSSHIVATQRASRGADILAACGQLRNSQTSRVISP
ncbi:MAG: 23S rRNA (adenine(2503)-C(2))-methyltransferase [Bdellovibrionales bacterium RIFOXYD1_FULL_53_11]|nr:MAG: 23S rRNA (adenine(2503)-C(2))-methyltransferase [Bdellovibrionales bacterium RIFOXYD1_FULL_53_11]